MPACAHIGSRAPRPFLAVWLLVYLASMALPGACPAQNDPPEDPCLEGETWLYRCPDGTELLWCTCEGPGCRPICDFIGSRSEGWYDSCTGDRYRWDFCETCRADCRHEGTGLEGWYDSCDGEVIVRAACAGRWSCLDESQFLADGDGDTVSPCDGDCDDGDPGAKRVPGEVSLESLVRSPDRLEVAWSDLAAQAGSSTLYDMVGGDLHLLAAESGFVSASCVLPQADVPACRVPFAEIPRRFYLLVRARNACGEGTYGESTLVPDPRDRLDDPALTPCP